MKVLAIESSCDDTSFAVVNDDKKVDFHETINHRKFHREHGGVVPEMAARQHLDIMDYLSKFQKKINRLFPESFWKNLRARKIFG